MEKLIKRLATITISAFFVFLILLNLIPIYLIISAFGSNYISYAALAFPSFASFFLSLATIDIFSIVFFIIASKQIYGRWKTLSYVAFLLPALYAGLGFLGLYWEQSLSPDQITLREAAALIDGCDITSLKKDSYENRTRLHTDRRDYVMEDQKNGKVSLGVRFVAEMDFNALMESGRSVQERCSYKFGGFLVKE
jgi:hypothetical protein